MTNKFKILGVGIAVLLIGIASWAFYQLLNKGSSDILILFGVTNFYVQQLIIIGTIGLILLFIFRHSTTKIFQSIARR